MQRATFYEDYCYDGDSNHLFGRYSFWIDFPDEIYEELYQIWFDNDGELNSWAPNWESHDKLYNTINHIATEILSKTVEKEWPEILPLSSWEVLWELSKETADAF